MWALDYYKQRAFAEEIKMWTKTPTQFCRISNFVCRIGKGFLYSFSTFLCGFHLGKVSD